MAAIAASALALAGCGESRSFTAEEFVEEVDEEGVKLELGRELVTDSADQELYGVELEPVAELPGGESSHTGGSLSVSDDDAGADEELAACEASADLLCFRAANVVVVLDAGGIEAERLGVAIERIAEE